jgi:hypothetical protein
MKILHTKTLKSGKRHVLIELRNDDEVLMSFKPEKYYKLGGQVDVDAIKAALAQPAQEPDHGDELTIAYMSGVHRGKELAAQPAQGPDYAYPTVEGYEELSGFKVNDTFRMIWAMARATNDLFKQMEKNNG